MPGNTTPIHGRVCRVAYGTAGAGVNIAETNGWSGTMTRDQADASAQGADSKKFLSGQYSWTFNFTGSLCLGNTYQKAVYDALISGATLTGATALEFVLDASGNYYTGDMNVQSFSVNAAIGDTVKFTCNLQGTGDITLTLGV